MRRTRDLRAIVAAAASSCASLSCQSDQANVAPHPPADASYLDADSSPTADVTETTDQWENCQHAAVKARCQNGWCEIPAGCVVVGSPHDEWGRAAVQEEQVAVTLTRAFVIQQTEVTQADWLARGLTNPSGTQPDGQGDCLDDAQCPVGRVTWFEALAYANLLSEQHSPPLELCYTLHGCQGTIGVDFHCTAADATRPTIYECSGFRLPTNAEREYASRAGTRTAFYSGSITKAWDSDPPSADPMCLADANLERIAWYCYNSNGRTHPAGQLEPNGWGLLDMSGNAAELTNDRSDGLPPTTSVDPGGTVGLHTNRNTRGGSIFSWSTLCRSASRLSAGWNDRRPALGFRLARTGTLE